MPPCEEFRNEGSGLVELLLGRKGLGCLCAWPFSALLELALAAFTSSAALAAWGGLKAWSAEAPRPLLPPLPLPQLPLAESCCCCFRKCEAMPTSAWAKRPPHLHVGLLGSKR